MSMSASSATGLQNEPNVTPMIDVLLVLLIIFMMIIPMSRRAIDIQLPDPNPAVVPANSTSQQIVLEILPGDQLQINKKIVLKNDLSTELKTIFDPRPEKIMFFKAHPQVKYQQVIWAMDMARGAGVKVLGLAPADKAATTGG
jgi:biopolymer transport protein ExbD